MNVKELKKAFGSGGAWKEELRIMVNEYCDVEIDLDIAGVIFYYSLGWWERCIVCNEMTDPSVSKCVWRLNMDKKLVNDIYCNDCEGITRNEWRISSEYPFSDD